jgi:DNA-directed RNA polymerase subunit E"
MPRERACRKCKGLTSGKVCSLCGSTDLSAEWSGLIAIIDPAKSDVAHTLGISKAGRYALRVS